MNNIITFDAELHPDVDNPAESLCYWLRQKLEGKKIKCSVIEDVDYAYTFRVVFEKRNFYLIIGWSRKSEKWEIYIDSGLSFIQKIFKVSDKKELLKLNKCLKSILINNKETSNVN